MHCIQSGTVAGYNTAFQRALLWCHDVFATEAINRYIEGLKKNPQYWVRMQGESSLDAAMELAEWYNATFSKQQYNPGPKNAGQVKGRNPGPNGQKKSAKKW